MWWLECWCVYHIVGFLRYLDSMNAWFSVFYNFIFTNGLNPTIRYCNLLISEDLNFMNLSISAKLVELKYLDKNSSIIIEFLQS